MLMHFETWWFYLKNYQSNKKFTEHKDCYSVVVFLSLTQFEPMFHGSLAISWSTYRNQLVYFADQTRRLIIL